MKENQTKNVENNNNDKGATKTQKINETKKRQKLAETQKFKSRYFEYYDDIKISDRQDW